MTKNILIENKDSFHYEIIESVIVKYYEILKIDKNIPVEIYLNIYNNAAFQKYITNKYPTIKFSNLKNYDYYINCTIYDAHFNNLNKEENSTCKYISHEITNRLENNPNVYFLTPLTKSNYIYADILPFSENKKHTNIPIYIIQGNYDKKRRNYNLIKKILEETYSNKFIIKFVGRGKVPNELQKYKNKITFKSNLDFIDYHKEFLDAYCILPLISKKTHPQYYTNKLTSSINYTRGYKLKCLIDRDLQQIYNLADVEVYNDINDITVAFKNTLKDFYNNTTI